MTSSTGLGTRMIINIKQLIDEVSTQSLDRIEKLMCESMDDIIQMSPQNVSMDEILEIVLLTGKLSDALKSRFPDIEFKPFSPPLLHAKFLH